MRSMSAIRSLLLLLAVLVLSGSASAQIGLSISVSFGPPALPIYDQPVCPAEDYLWVPGYWAYDNNAGYFWVPGTWVEVPQVGYLWTPGYWGWGGSGFIFHEGYWGPQVGFYGGINYGFGYVGNGYQGGRWEGNHFAYNTYVNHVNTTIIHNTYNTTIVNVTENHISYNGGNGGIQARPSPQEEAYASQHHVGPVAAQTQHIQAARSNPELRASANQGKPPIAATSKPGEFRTGVIASKQAGGEYKPPPASAVRANAKQPPPTHASELEPHAAAPRNPGNPAPSKQEQQQAQLAAKQNQDHQKLQQQQEKEHQQATAKNYSPAQKQQLEQRHAQQTQHLEQKHATQTQHLQQRQPAPKEEKHPPA